MNIYLLPSWLLTDEHPKAAKGIPILINLGNWKAYQHGDRIGTVSALQVVSRAVERRGENYFLPEENDFISRFTEGDHETQSAHGSRMENMKKLTHGVKEVLKRVYPTGAGPSGPIPT